MLPLVDLVAASLQVASTRARTEKTRALGALLKRLTPEEVPSAVAYLSGTLPQGRIGIGFAAVRKLSETPSAPQPTLTLLEVDATLSRFATLKGTGSSAQKQQLLSALFGKATPDEQTFLGRLLVGELRQGALEGVMADAIAQAANVPASSVRRAFMFAGDAGRVALAALTQGEGALAQFRLELFNPLQPMLAQPAADVEEVLQALDEAALEYKLDGARVQVHRDGNDVRVFSREGNDVTGAAPEVVESVLAMPGRSLVLDGEAIALRADGTPQPFQVTMRLFGRRLDVEALRKELPLSTFFFDVLHVEGKDLVDLPYTERMATLDGLLPAATRVPRKLTASEEEASAFYDEALARGHEGLLAKAAKSSYEAGLRGRSWLKLKPAHTLDLVVIAVEWGSGRRQGWLSNLHLGARDPSTGSFVMLGKTFKGLTDAMLKWQTDWFLAHELSRDAHTVYVKPELVVEIALDSVQASPHYPAGMALRFARVKRYREDKPAAEADTVETVRRLFSKTHGNA
ncbi:MAG: ATP-dependent DNA ligase [Myxococcaceae bacterium]